MKSKDNERTSQDILFEMIKQIGGPLGPLMLESFKAEVLPRLKRSPGWDKTLTEEQYQDGLAKMQQELPLFLTYLLSRKDLPEPPPDWTPSQN